MARILVLMDRPQAADRTVLRTLELAHSLEARQIFVVVTCREVAFPVTRCSFSVPDAGFISADSLSAWSLSVGGSDTAIAKQFLAQCRLDAAFYGLALETARSDLSLRSTATMFGGAVGLMVVCREALLDDNGRLVSLRRLRSRVRHPWLICPTKSESWKRIVVAISSDAQRGELIAWGRHWSEKLDLPLERIELGAPPSRSPWSAVMHTLAWRDPRQRREAVHRCLLACGLGPDDLLLVNREPATWPRLANACEASLDDLIAVAPCSVGVVPTTATVATRWLLFPQGLAHMDRQSLESVTT